MAEVQELVGVVADLAWDQNTGNLNLVAACHLAANTPLTSGLTALAANPEHLIMTHQPESLAQTQQMGQEQGCVLLPWQAPHAASFQLYIEPPEEDELKETKLEILVASSLGTQHALTAASSQVNAAVCCLVEHH